MPKAFPLNSHPTQAHSWSPCAVSIIDPENFLLLSTCCIPHTKQDAFTHAASWWISLIRQLHWISCMDVLLEALWDLIVSQLLPTEGRMVLAVFFLCPQNAHHSLWHCPTLKDGGSSKSTMQGGWEASENLSSLPPINGWAKVMENWVKGLYTSFFWFVAIVIC